MTYGNGATVSYTYDNLDRVTVETWNGEPKYYYFYDAEGNLAKKLDEDTKNAVHYEYDSLGRLIHSYQTTENGIVQKTEHLYDTENRIKSQSWQLGTTVYSESYDYDPDDGSLYTVTPTWFAQYAYEYDALKRQSSRYNWYYKTNYSYAAGKNSGETTTQVSRIFHEARPGGTSFSEFGIDYTYDAQGNILTIRSTEWPALNATYTYDQQGQLITETNSNGSYVYTYDTYGNIRTAKNAASSSATTFSYGDSNWLDLLTAYKGTTINYDAIGNPLNWKNSTTWSSLTWQNGRQLASIASSDKSLSFTYDLAGIRDSKTVTTSSGTVTYNYLTQNGQVVRQSWTGTDNVSHVMDFLYDNQGKPYAADYDGTRYYYVLNLQGDVLRMVDINGATVASYVYDAWGRLISTSGSMASTNPLRYRGYYYDAETGLYYLGSRYYDPLVKRFINSDTSNLILTNPNSLNDKNLFAYCDNNPVMRTDDGGMLWQKVVLGAAFGAAIGAVSSAVDEYIAGGDLGDILWAGTKGALIGAVDGAVKAATSSILLRAITSVVATGVAEIAVQKIRTPSNQFGAYDVAAAVGTAIISNTISVANNSVLKGACTGLSKAGEAVVTKISNGIAATAKQSFGFIYSSTISVSKQRAISSHMKQRNVIWFAPAKRITMKGQFSK